MGIARLISWQVRRETLAGLDLHNLLSCDSNRLHFNVRFLPDKINSEELQMTDSPLTLTHVLTVAGFVLALAWTGLYLMGAV